MSWPDWRGETVACVATGPSLTKAQLDACYDKAKVVAVNDVGLPNRKPFNAGWWCDIWYCADLKFMEHYRAEVGMSSALRVCAQREAVARGLADRWFDCRRDKGQFVSGGHSGFQALQLAMATGAARVLLLGYDCRPAPSGGTNYFGQKPKRLEQSSPYEHWPKHYRELKLTCPVLNCTPDSALDAFPFVALTDALQAVAA